MYLEKDWGHNRFLSSKNGVCPQLSLLDTVTKRACQ